MANPKRYSEKIIRKENSPGMMIPEGSYNMRDHFDLVRPLFETHFQSLLAGTGKNVHAKLEISHPQDRSERQADEFAGSVLTGNTAKSKSTLQGTATDINTKGEGSGLSTTPQFDSLLQSTKGQGTKLDPGTKSELESHTGTDLGGVNIHNNQQSDQLSSGIHAKAFAHGQDIYFKSGNYDTASASGKSLLAHEVAHTVQQGQGVQTKLQREELDKESSKRIMQDYFRNWYLGQSGSHPKMYLMQVTGDWDTILAAYTENGRDEITDPELMKLGPEKYRYTNRKALDYMGTLGGFSGAIEEEVLDFMFKQITANTKTADQTAAIAQQLQSFGTSPSSGAWKDFSDTISATVKATVASTGIDTDIKAIEKDRTMYSIDRTKKILRTITGRILPSDKTTTVITAGKYTAYDPSTTGDSLYKMTMDAVAHFKSGVLLLQGTEPAELKVKLDDLDLKMAGLSAVDPDKYKEVTDQTPAAFNKQVDDYLKGTNAGGVVREYYSNRKSSNERTYNYYKDDKPLLDAKEAIIAIRKLLDEILALIKSQSEEHIQAFTITDKAGTKVKTMDQLTWKKDAAIEKKRNDEPGQFQKLISLMLDYKNLELGQNNVFTIHYDARTYGLNDGDTDAKVKTDVIAKIDEAVSANGISVIRAGGTGGGKILAIVLFEAGNIKIVKLTLNAFESYTAMGDAMEQVFALGEADAAYTPPAVSFTAADAFFKEWDETKPLFKKGRHVKNEDTQEAMAKAITANSAIWNNPMAVRIIQMIVKAPLTGVFDNPTVEQIAKWQRGQALPYPKPKKKKGEKGINFDPHWGVVNLDELKRMHTYLVQATKNRNAAIILILDYYNLLEQLETLQKNGEFSKERGSTQNPAYTSNMYPMLTGLYYKKDAAEAATTEAAATFGGTNSVSDVIMGEGSVYGAGGEFGNKSDFESMVNTLAHELGHVKQNEGGYFPTPVHEMYAELMELRGTFGNTVLPVRREASDDQASYYRGGWEYLSLGVKDGALNTDYRTLIDTMRQVAGTKNIPKVNGNPSNADRARDLAQLKTDITAKDSEIRLATSTTEQNKLQNERIGLLNKKNALCTTYIQAILAEDQWILIDEALVLWDASVKWVETLQLYEQEGNYAHYRLETVDYRKNRDGQDLVTIYSTLQNEIGWYNETTGRTLFKPTTDVILSDPTFFSPSDITAYTAESKKSYEKIKGKMYNPLSWIVDKFNTEIRVLAEDPEIKSLTENISTLKASLDPAKLADMVKELDAKEKEFKNNFGPYSKAQVKVVTEKNVQIKYNALVNGTDNKGTDITKWGINKLEAAINEFKEPANETRTQLQSDQTKLDTNPKYIIKKQLEDHLKDFKAATDFDNLKVLWEKSNVT